MEKFNFHYTAVLLKTLYGMEMDDEDLEEAGLVAWELIGNKDYRLYRYSTNLDNENSITLPCNAYEVDSITTNYEDWPESTNYSDNGDLYKAYIEQSIENSKKYTSPFYQSGKLLKYHQVGNTIYFDKNYGQVNILYKGILMDEDGLPELTEKEALAIATYLAYMLKLKDGIATNNTVTINLALHLNGIWLKRCDLARVTQLSQNDMKEIFDIKGSFDRASYGNSFKYRR